MSVKVEDSENQKLNLKQKCANCFKGPNSFKTIVICICVGLAVVQITSSVQKLVHKPIATYTHFDFNTTIAYPSITFCREPPYKQDKLQDYGLYAHPRFTSTWRNFNFSQIPLDELWEEITYNAEDFFVQYGLDTLTANVEVTPVMGFLNGRCYTLSPKFMNTTARPSLDNGYSITLQHTAEDMEDPISFHPPGYHVHIHYVREPYTEVQVYNGGLVDYLYVNTGETVDVKLTVDEYVMISQDGDPCSNAENYSANDCTARYVSNIVTESLGCSGPWMQSEMPYCNNFEDMRNLISSYISTHQNHDCQDCPRFCRSYLYNAYVTDRQRFYTWNSNDGSTSAAAALQTQIYIHFNNMMVSVYEERFNYDWNLFLSDLGGSVGFLLGLSVISLINIIGSLCVQIICPIITKKTKKEVANVSTSTCSLYAANINTISKNDDTYNGTAVA